MNINNSPISVDVEYGGLKGDDYTQSRYRVYLYDGLVRTSDWVTSSVSSAGYSSPFALESIKQEYTDLYEKFLTKRFRQFLGYEW